MATNKKLESVSKYQKYQKPLYIFIAIWVITYLLILAIDLIHASGSKSQIIKATLTGSLFLSQIIATLLSTFSVYMLPKIKGSLKIWYGLSAIILIIACAAVLFYQYGPRDTEKNHGPSDGPGTMQFECVFGELYWSASNNNALCIIKNMPMAASNIVQAVTHPATDWQFYTPDVSKTPEIIVFAGIETVLGVTALALTAKPASTNKAAKKTKQVNK